MAATGNHAYADVETYVYYYITNIIGLNKSAACGIIANMYKESGLNPSSTNGSSGAYGLCQWLGGRKTNLVSRSNYHTASTQLEFLKYELESSESASMDRLKNEGSIKLNTRGGAYNAGYYFSKDFERHGGGDTEHKERGKLAERCWDYYNDPANVPSSATDPTGGSLSGVSIVPVANLGQRIVSIAIDKSNAKSDGSDYLVGGNGPDKFDGPGLVYFCYNSVGVSIPDLTAQSYYNTYKSTARSIAPANASAGDLLFYADASRGVYDIAIADGNGGRVHASSPTVGIVHDTTTLDNPTYILRILEDTETSQGTNYAELGASGVTNYHSVVMLNPYVEKINANLSRVTATGFDYGYLIDLTHGGEFKFYVPEFSESAGVNWQDVEIIGRSVTVKAYNHTSSRKITLNLDLFAGEGVYEFDSEEEAMTKLHKDVNFLKSLEYPDYSNPIVRPPSTVQLILGANINLVGVIESVTVDNKKPLDAQNRSMYVSVAINFAQTAIDPPDYLDIRKGDYTVIDPDIVNNTPGIGRVLT